MLSNPDNIRQIFRQQFPSLYSANSSDLLLENSTVEKVDKDTVILKVDQVIRYVPMLLEGTVKVLRIDRDGNELFLYHILPGESCAVTLKAFLAKQKSLIKAVAVEESKLMLVPDHLVRRIYQSDSVFLNFILDTYHGRFEELLLLIDQIAFQRIDKRLLQLLKERSEALDRNVLQITHQQLADELNSSREVVSRLLKQMENKGLLALGRNQIKIISPL